MSRQESSTSSAPLRRVLLALLLAACAALVVASPSAATPLADDGGAEWQVEQPLPPPPEQAGVVRSEIPVSLGHIGDIEFYEPNRGALITDGNGGSVGPGVWFYDGLQWRELSDQCGATDGRIAWAGPDEFWTVSDGRAGQANASTSERPPLEDNTLCHFAPGPGGNLEIVASYASLPFKGNSYQPIHAAACLSPSNCWFGGAPLPLPQVGAFMLHWNGTTLEPNPYLPEARQVFDMRPFEEHVFESMRLLTTDLGKRSLRPPPLRAIKASFALEESPFEEVEGVPLYSSLEFSYALDYLHLSTADNALWAAAGPQVPTPEGSRNAGVTIVRKEEGQPWTRVIAPTGSETEEEQRLDPPPGVVAFGETTLDSIGAEPGTSSAWVALIPTAEVIQENPHARAQLARVSSAGAISDRLELPLTEDAHGPLGAAQRVICPATHDCWATTSHGWLLHLRAASENEHPNQLADPVFSKIEAEEPITFRPADEGVPQEPSDELPEDNSGETGLLRNEEVIKEPTREPAKVPVPLLTHVHSRIVHRTMLVLSFHLAVKARIALTAYHKKQVVAKSGQHTLKAGNRSLQLKLNPKRWPTRLHLATHALAPLPTQSTAAPNVGSVSTSFVAPARLLSTGLAF
jgi:hypothetical protein